MVFVAKNFIIMELTFPAATAVAVENLDLVADSDKNCVGIMKDGKIYQNMVK